MLYSELQCSEAIRKAVERMGFAEMTEIQEKTIPVMLAGHDVIAKALRDISLHEMTHGDVAPSPSKRIPVRLAVA